MYVPFFPRGTIWSKCTTCLLCWLLATFVDSMEWIKQWVLSYRIWQCIPNIVCFLEVPLCSTENRKIICFWANLWLICWYRITFNNKINKLKNKYFQMFRHKHMYLSTLSKGAQDWWYHGGQKNAFVCRPYSQFKLSYSFTVSAV